MHRKKSIQQIDIYKILRDYFPGLVLPTSLTKQFSIRCPFHADKSGNSMRIYADTNSAHCFGGCGSFDPVGMVARQLGIPYFEARKELAKQYGIETLTPEEEAEQRRLALLEQYIAAIQLHLNEEHITALMARGLTRDEIATRRIGYHPINFSAMSDEDMMALGVYRRNSSGDIESNFAEKIILPCMLNQRLVYVTAWNWRQLADEPKYAFPAGWPKPVIGLTGDRPFIVEGWFDLTACEAAGQSVLCLLGSDPTREQMAFLRHQPELTILMDGDDAGSTGAKKLGAELFPKAVRVDLPPGEDPNSLLLKIGHEGFTAFLREAPQVNILDAAVAKAAGADASLWTARVVDEEVLPLLAKLSAAQQGAAVKQVAQALKKQGITEKTIEKGLRSEYKSEKKNAQDWQPPGEPLYFIESNSLFMRKETKDGPVPVQLSNFVLQIVQTESHDEGAGETTQFFTLEGIMENGVRLPRRLVPAKQFSSLNWVSELYPPEALVYAGFGTKDHLRCAIQMLSGRVPSRIVYKHLGWRKINGVWMYLHAAGALGPDGPVSNVMVELEGKLREYELPETPTVDNLTTAIRSIFNLLAVAPPEIMFPLLATVFRAPLSEALAADLSVFLAGRTGTKKTCLTAIVQAFWGAGFSDRNLPASWESTGNSLEKQSFLTKDAVLVIDDFAPRGTSSDVARLHRDADRVLRAQGNMAGRDRMRSDTSLRPGYVPRGLIIASGEDVPRGESLRSRGLIIEVTPDAVNLARLTEAQQMAREGVFALCMSGYVQWLAPQIDELKTFLRRRKEKLRVQARAEMSFTHDRTPDIVATLFIGWEQFLNFVTSVNAMPEVERERIAHGAWQALLAAGGKQSAFINTEDPVDRFIALLSAAISGGEAHLTCAVTGEAPEDEEAWGWRRVTHSAGETLQGQGKLMGWIAGAEAWLEPEIAFSIAQNLASRQHNPILLTQRTLYSRLADRGLTVPEKTADQVHTTVRRTVRGHRKRVLLFANKDTLIFQNRSNRSFRSEANKIVPSTVEIRDLNENEQVPCTEKQVPEEDWLDLNWGPLDLNENGQVHKMEVETYCNIRTGPDGPDGPELEYGTCQFCAEEITHIPHRCMGDDDPDETAPADVLAVDIETTGLDPHAGEIRLLSCAKDINVKVLDTPEPMREVLADPASPKVFHNAAFDVTWLTLKNYPVINYQDTMLMAQVLSNNQGEHGLAALAKTKLGIELDKEKQKPEHWQGAITEEHREYARRDAEVTYKLYQVLKQELHDQNMEAVYERERAALPAIIRLQLDGIPFDAAGWREALQAHTEERDKLGAEIKTELHTSINLASPKQLLDCLRNRDLDLRDTADETLAIYEEKMPVLATLRRWREKNKLVTSYGKELLKLVSPDGRIYPSWRLIGATTGRMSCSNPNIQQVPADMRKYFKASPGRVLVIADYSQIELRVAAELSEDKRMRDALSNCADLHTLTAQQILKRTDVSKDERQIAKAANFGLIYGMSPKGLQAQLRTAYNINASEEECAQFRREFFCLYPGIRAWHDKQIRADRVMTAGGRVWGGLPKPTAGGWKARLNYPVQGTAAEGMKEALSLLAGALPKEWKLCAAVHDEVLIEVPERQAEQAKEVVTQCMVEGMKKLVASVLVVVECRTSKTWDK